MQTQPQVFIHRDYHSRNLMIVGESKDINIGVIDFQDAMRGPFTYDLVSLLKIAIFNGRVMMSFMVNLFL